ncbi:MAG: hypothetical protein P8R54_25815 [Myxococcota bacterium]|nr:hypothetical protein [Myxococcota bacterium]
MLSLLLAACQEPFSEDRHDLVGFRIVGIGVEDGVAKAAVWSGEGPWHEQTPTLSWALDGEPLGEGFEVTVPAEEGVLSLTATSASGEERTAVVDVRSSGGALTVARQAVVIDGLTLEERRAVTGSNIETAAQAGEAVRLTLSTLSDVESARWMSAGGTIMELEADTADFLAEDIVIDDGELISREDAGVGRYPLLALVIDGQGGNRWLWTDAAVGSSELLLRHEGRLVVSDAAAEPGLIAATLIEDAIGGVGLSDVVPVTDTAEQDDLPCIPAVPMSLSWIAEGRCARADVLGARVVLEVW